MRTSISPHRLLIAVFVSTFIAHSGQSIVEGISFTQGPLGGQEPDSVWSVFE